MKCPACKHDDTLMFEREALILLPLKNGMRLPKHYVFRDITLLGDGLLMCAFCGASSDDNHNMECMKNFILDIADDSDEEGDETDGNTRKCG